MDPTSKRLSDRACEPGRPVMVSVVTPALNEGRNLPLFYERLRRTLDKPGIDWEWIVVDDHSTDDTCSVLGQLAARDVRVRGLRLSRNFGSHTAMTCGLRQARGDCAVFLAADLQDPPEVIEQLLAPWRDGFEVVWAVRRRRAGESARTVAFSRVYWFLMRHVVGFKQMAATGADFFLIGRRALDALNRIDEANVNAFSLIAWLGFPQTSIAYDKQPRLHGRSGWTLARKFKLVIDSITAYSYLPMRVMSGTGLLLLAGSMGSGAVAARRFVIASGTAAGLPLILAVLLGGFGLVLLSLGILGEYLWRTFEQVSGRPRYVVEQVIEGRPMPAASPDGQASRRPQAADVSSASCHEIDEVLAR